MNSKTAAHIRTLLADGNEAAKLFANPSLDAFNDIRDEAISKLGTKKVRAIGAHYTAKPISPNRSIYVPPSELGCVCYDLSFAVAAYNMNRTGMNQYE